MDDVKKVHKGLIKRIQMAIPGYRGYRKREDLRIADNMLRSHITSRIEKVTSKMDLISEMLSKKLMMDLLNDISSTEEMLHTVGLEISHAQAGYSGISSDFQFDVDDISELYKFDEDVLSSVNNLDELIEEIYSRVEGGM